MTAEKLLFKTALTAHKSIDSKIFLINSNKNLIFSVWKEVK